MKQVRYILTLTAFFVAVPAAVSAQTPFSKPCSEYEKIEDFIANSAAYCLSREHQRNCERAAERYFVSCGYGSSSDFRQRQSRAYKDILVRLVLNRAPAIMAVEESMR